MAKIKFIKLALDDISIIQLWFNLPHVQEYYSLRHWTREEVSKKLTPYITGEKPVSGYMIYLNSRPIGYIQMYQVLDFPWDNQNLSTEVIENSAGIDLFIGDMDLLGKGLGYKIIKQFLCEKIWPQFQYCIVDPQINNHVAIHCYKKLGFKHHKKIQTKDALNKETTLVLMIKSKVNPE